MLNAQHVAYFIYTVASGIDHFFAGNVAFEGMHNELAISFTGNVFYRIKTIHLSPRFSGFTHHGKGNTGWVDVTI